MKKTLLAVALALAFTAPAQAGIELRFRLAFTTPDEPITWIYDAVLVSGRIVPGSTISQHITCYDVAGLLDAGGSSADWPATIQSAGVDAEDARRTGRDDSPRVMNVTWTYTGSVPIDTTAGPVVLSTIRFRAVAPSTGLGTCISQTNGRRGPTTLISHP